MRKKVLIVGSGYDSLMAAKIAELKAQNPYMEVVTIEEAKEQFYCESENNGGKRCRSECKTCKTIPEVLKQSNFLQRIWIRFLND